MILACIRLQGLFGRPYASIMRVNDAKLACVLDGIATRMAAAADSEKPIWMGRFAQSGSSHRTYALSADLPDARASLMVRDILFNIISYLLSY